MADTVGTMLFVAALLLLAVVAPSPSEAATNKTDCPTTCGNLKIPYPFGIGPNCSLNAGFEILCNNSKTPVLASNVDYEILDLSLESSGILLHLPVAYECFNKSTGTCTNWSYGAASFDEGVYRISNTRNELFVLGCNSLAYLGSIAATARSSKSTYVYVGCVSYCSDINSTTEGECEGVGCCKVSIPPDLTNTSINVNGWSHKDIYDFNPCDFSFLAAQGSYSFSRADLLPPVNMTGLLPPVNVTRKMPVWLDWAIRKSTDGTAKTCENASKDTESYACKSQNSSCINSVNGVGYSCQCNAGYEGNPYIKGDGGCTNINECNYPQNYTCYGRCRDTEGSYECTCPRGKHGKPKEARCEPNFPREAQIAIGVISGNAFLTILVTLMLMAHHKRKLKDFFERNGGPMLANINNIQIFTKDQLKQITKDYSNILGKGGFGQVYMGIIDNKQVAVKRSISVDQARKKEFANEIIIQSRISHKNVVKLVGCCLEVDVPMLVYEFAPRGSLYDVLHGTTENGKTSLPLGTRLDIAADSAEALSYMHTSTTQKILHGDVKSGNILLDENFHPKVSDFGTSRLLTIEKKQTIFVIGDMNYIDPVYMKTGLLDEKSDVYSFGVVLLELITRKKPRYDGNNSLLINFLKSFASDERARELYDAEIASVENIEFLEKVGSIAVACVNENMDERPNMKEVSEHLQLVRREWKQRQGMYGAPMADEVSMESPVSLTMDAPTGAETPGYSPLLK